MNTLSKHLKSLMAIFVVLSVVILSACSGGNNDNDSPGDTEKTLTVSSTGPVSDAVGVAINSRITVTFKEAIRSASFDAESFTLSVEGGARVMGEVSLDAATNTGIFRSNSNFQVNTPYIATITTAVESEDGKVLSSNYQWSFTTGSEADNTAPTVTSTDPDDEATSVAINRNISASFSEAMYVPSLNELSFLVTDDDKQPVTGTIEVVGTTAVFNPADDLATNTRYIVELTNDVMDLAENRLAASYSWSFTTGDSVAQGPAPVVLGTAGDYVILAKSGISTTGTTAITGDIAVSPADETYITGFSQTRDSTNVFSTSDKVTGKIFAANMAVPTPSNLTTAISDMQTAYTDAAGRKNPDYTELGAGDISGKTLTPGLYKWGSGLNIGSDVTLSGGADDVWILQVAGDLTVGNGVKVTLADGALAKNIFWQVAGNTTFGTTSEVKGVFLSKTKIEAQTGAKLNGRALAQTAVTLDANPVTQPTE